LHSMLLAHSLRLLQLSSEAFEAVSRIFRGGGGRSSGFSITAFVAALHGSFLSNLLPLLLGALAVSPTAGHPVLAVRLLPSLLHLMRVVDSLNMRLSALKTEGDPKAVGSDARSLPVELDWLLRLECSLGILCGTLSRSLIAADHIRLVRVIIPPPVIAPPPPVIACSSQSMLSLPRVCISHALICRRSLYWNGGYRHGFCPEGYFHGKMEAPEAWH
jgi:hypothetical protein